MGQGIRVALSRGQFALIDEADFPLVSGLQWFATPSSTGQFYAAARVKNASGRSTSLYMHRLITGAPKGKEVDHVNHDTLDNRRENLRIGSHKDNMQNGKFALATHCPKGHPYDEKNTLWMKSKNGRQCKECARQWTAEALARETPEQKADREAKKKAYYLRNHEAEKAKRRAYAKAHPEEARARYKKWYDARKRGGKPDN